MTRFTAELSKSSFGSFKKPCFASHGSWNTNCNTPPINTAHASAVIGGSKYGTKKQGGHDERYVQQHGREGGNLEFVVGIEYRADERRERNQQDIGEHNPQQVGGQRQLVGIFAESGRRRTDNPRCSQHADGGNDGQRKRQHPRHILHKFPRRLRRLRLAVFRQNGDERLRKRAFGKIRRRRFGSLNAVRNASVASPAPNTRAIIISRTNPSMRDTIVRLPSFAKAPSRFIKKPLSKIC